MGETNRLRGLSLEKFQELSLTEKGELLHEPLYHVLIAQQFRREQLDELCELSTRIRRIAKTRSGLIRLKTVLADKRAMLYFAQPSTRTYLSFLSACQILGMDTMDVRDTSTSSELKGESPADSVRTFSSYADIIIMRHRKEGFAEEIAVMLSNVRRSVPVVNAGSGKDQHPTQALLDIYTLQRSFKEQGGIDGKTVMFTGDLARGRTVRSLAWLLTLYDDVRLLFVAPREFQIRSDIQELLDHAGINYDVSYDFEKALPAADAVYMTRIQDEHDRTKGESAKVDISSYSFGVRHLKLIKPNAIVMHPLPRRHEISVEVDNDPRAMYWRQVRNGMWMRAALILSIFRREEEINELYTKGS